MQSTIPWDLKDKYRLSLGHGSHFGARVFCILKGVIYSLETNLELFQNFQPAVLSPPGLSSWFAVKGMALLALWTGMKGCIVLAWLYSENMVKEPCLSFCPFTGFDISKCLYHHTLTIFTLAKSELSIQAYIIKIWSCCGKLCFLNVAVCLNLDQFVMQ